MKKIIILLFLLLFSSALLPVSADDNIDSSSFSDVMKYTNSVENAFVGQKKITDEEFDKVYKEVKAKQDKKKKGEKPKPFKGKDFNDENNGGYIKETADKTLLLSVPLELTNGDGIEIPIGHYKIVGEKNNGQVYLDFYQSSTLIAKVPAIETQSDFDQTAINFVQIIPYNEQRIKLIYGSIDFNAYTFIKIKNEISD